MDKPPLLTQLPANGWPCFTVLHVMQGRCRMRISRLRADRVLRERVECALAANPLVTSFHFNIACESVTVNFHGSMHALLARMEEESRSLAAAPERSAPVLIATLSDKAPLRALGWAASALLLSPILGTPFAMVPLILASLPIWRRALATVVDERRLNVDFLDGLALAVAVVRGMPASGAVMALMVHFGDVVRELTARQSRSQIRQLLDFQTVQARLLDARGGVTLIAAQCLNSGQMTLVLAGDLVPADGEVCNGVAAVDQRHITGESTPATRRCGDRVFAGSAVVEGSITVRVTAAGADTVVAKIVELVETAPVGETRIQNYAEKFADRLVAPLLGANLALLAATGNLDRFMSLAIVDYGTGIRVAAPTSVLSSMTRAAREGILIKSGCHVEHLAGLQGIAFDKTGTLTCGRMKVLEVRSWCVGLSEDRVLQLAAAVEVQLRHPVARALVAHAREIRGMLLPACEDVQYTIGMGVVATIAGHRILVGSERFMGHQGIATRAARTMLDELEREGHIALLVALDDSLIGAISCSDAARPEAHAVICGLRRRGVREIVMLTGDREGVAQRLARSIGIEKVYSQVLPHEKAAIVRRLRAAGGTYAMVGDGVNDSPALAQADVGISLADGADIARAAADVILMEEGLHLLLPAIDISREALALVRQNYTLIAGANTLALALALPTGWISPVFCTLLSNGSALAATLNAMRPLMASRKHYPFTLATNTQTARHPDCPAAMCETEQTGATAELILGSEEAQSHAKSSNHGDPR
jgi:Cu2+-exporting ATPase